MKLRAALSIGIAIAVPAALGVGVVTSGPAKADTPVQLVVNGNDVLSGNINGLTFKGFGLVSANSTSNLLMDYKAEHPAQYWQLIGTLFCGPTPIIDEVKIEMGTDTNNSTGADAATMRSADELANASRSPGFQLAADAKTVDPGLKVSILRWEMPEWVQNAWNQGSSAGYPAVYKWYKETILNAYLRYGYMVDYVDPDTNETTSPDTAFIKWYASEVKADTDFSDPRYRLPADEQAAAEAAYHNIKVMASDENTTMNIGPDMLSDPALFSDVSAVGYHYTTEDAASGPATSNTYQPYTKLALGQTPTGEDKEVWYSEGSPTFGYTEYRANDTEGANGGDTGIGGVQSALDIANRVVKSFADSKRTLYLFQPAIGAFYQGAQYSYKELVSASTPWSGYLHYDASLYVLEQFTRFAKMGWENGDNTAGIWRAVPEASYSGATGTNAVDGSNGAPSYLTLAAPDKSAFSTVIVNDSDQAKTYQITTQNMNLGSNATMEAWETRAAGPGQATDANYLHLAATMAPDASGTYTYTVQPRSIVTLTTLDKAHDPAMARRLPQTPPNTVLDTDSTGKTPDASDDYLYADNFEYKNEGDVRVGAGNGSRTASEPYLQSRGGQPRYFDDETGAWEVQPGSAGNHVLYQLMDQSMKDTKAWNPALPNTLVGDSRWENYTAAIDVSFPDPAGGTAALGVREIQGMTIGGSAYNVRIQPSGSWTFYSRDTVIASGTVPASTSYHLATTAAGATITTAIDGKVVETYTDPHPELAGRVALGSDFTKTGFDNLTVMKVPGYTPYVSTVTDNLDSSVSYTGTWSRNAANGNATDYFRTTSTTSTPGATISVPFSGTGIDLVGANDGSAVLDVSVDGKLLAAGAATLSSGHQQAAYTLRGLPAGRHTATFVLDSGTLVVDAFYAISGNVSGRVDTTVLRQAIASVGNPQMSQYKAATWSVFKNTLDAARAAMGGQRGLDTIGVAQLASRLTDAYQALVPSDVTDTSESLGLIGAIRTTGQLPATVQIDGGQHAVTWTAVSQQTARTAYTEISVAGWTNDAYVNNEKQAFTARYEVVPPSLSYFIDSGVASGQVSPQYAAVASAQQLLNSTADQVSTSSGTWGYIAAGANVKAATNPADIYSTGLWASSGQTIQYRLPLPAGSYVLTVGFNEWWGQTRTMTQAVTFTDSAGAPQDVTGPNVTISGGSPEATGTVQFTLDAPATVTYTVGKSGSNDPVISWLGVASLADSTTAG